MLELPVEFALPTPPQVGMTCGLLDAATPRAHPLPSRYPHPRPRPPSAPAAGPPPPLPPAAAQAPPTPAREPLDGGDGTLSTYESQF